MYTYLHICSQNTGADVVPQVQKLQKLSLMRCCDVISKECIPQLKSQVGHSGLRLIIFSMGYRSQSRTILVALTGLGLGKVR